MNLTRTDLYVNGKSYPPTPYTPVYTGEHEEYMREYNSLFQAFGISGAAAKKSMISSNAATSRGAAMLLASGMKISAEPKPENPRAVPETKAMAQMATAILTLTSAGMRPMRLMLSSFVA